MAKSGMSGPLMNLFLSWHPWLVLGWQCGVPQAAQHCGHGAPDAHVSS